MTKSEILAEQFVMLLTDYIITMNTSEQSLAVRRMRDHVKAMIEYTGEDT